MTPAPHPVRTLLGQLARFGAVGFVGFVVDVLVFNALRLTMFAPDVVELGPLYAKVVATGLAILTNWIGNRLWTFRRARRNDIAREGIEFLAASLAGMVIGLACLWVSHYVLGYTSVLADNIASNVIGLALGAVFRFVLYRNWVYAPRRSRVGAGSSISTAATAAAAAAAAADR
jgi:putative flippase GtrA